MISASIKIRNPEILVRLKARGPQIIDALTLKMNQLMVRLQAKVVGETIPTLFPHGAPNIASTVMFQPARIDGTKILGTVTAGETSGSPKTIKTTLKSGAQVDYAAVQEYGVDHGWTIEPFSKRALAFVLDGKQMIRKRVFHPPLEARPFMRSALGEMGPQITSELGETFEDTLNG